MEQNGNSNVGSIVNAVSAASITVHPLQSEIVGAAVSTAVVLDDLAGAEQMESGRKPEHVKNCQNGVRYEWKNYQSLDFSDDFCSNLEIISKCKTTAQTDLQIERKNPMKSFVLV